MVVVYPCTAYRDPRRHERVTLTALARELAVIKGWEFGGEFDPARAYDIPLYFVPSDTLPSLDFARGLGIHGEAELFGGVVPYPFAATKTITHALPEPGGSGPRGWSADFARRVQPVVLPGYSAFTRDDARRAAERLLVRGAVRLKRADGIGGSGQAVIRNTEELAAQLDQLDATELARAGVVLERNLAEVETCSVGRVRVGDLVATYFGTQQLTPNNRGELVYGGSRLSVVRGDFDALLPLAPTAALRTAVEQAQRYHTAAMVSFPGMYASRCNYDIAQGLDEGGHWCSGVLEQSWRIGGASGAEIAALKAFVADPGLDAVNASTVEVYGPAPALPDDAFVYFNGVDEHAGRITKYSRLELYGHP
ncbi:DUF3182 family protein [Aquabacterium sp. A7-Y]|uniref:DUF3182 family protein n=1 Tax=Aquabacterium sp. A7-Y TaxID=1349605 RepID=UPI00223E3EAF|nr:DUF3182 family protein [Aquabacterium sp. A7-Y]MCW7537886.1 DUF3182 family protein [Aquabacterium sp. A7-Y]